jgi:hypothetical protein
VKIQRQLWRLECWWGKFLNRNLSPAGYSCAEEISLISAGRNSHARGFGRVPLGISLTLLRIGRRVQPYVSGKEGNGPTPDRTEAVVGQGDLGHGNLRLDAGVVR